MKNKTIAILYILMGLFITVVLSRGIYVRYNERELTLETAPGIIFIIMMISCIFYEAWKKIREKE